jgi:hypothetical protein
VSDISVSHPGAYEGLTIWVGDGITPVHVDSTVHASDLREYFKDPIVRAVAVARLRATADALNVTGDTEGYAYVPDGPWND